MRPGAVEETEKKRMRGREREGETQSRIALGSKKFTTASWEVYGRVSTPDVGRWGIRDSHAPFFATKRKAILRAELAKLNLSCLYVAMYIDTHVNKCFCINVCVCVVYIDGMLVDPLVAEKEAKGGGEGPYHRLSPFAG